MTTSQKFTEAKREQAIIELLQRQEYPYTRGTDLEKCRSTFQVDSGPKHKILHKRAFLKFVSRRLRDEEANYLRRIQLLRSVKSSHCFAAVEEGGIVSGC